jgi:2-keto-4-pentenoate hydratase/2-oxohepta-3-ene-1,7-dioic acid hydratase in catechol pathway
VLAKGIGRRGLRIARLIVDDQPRYARVEDGVLYPLSVPGDAATGDLISAGALQSAAKDRAGIAATEARFLAPVVRPSKVVAIGLNYASHAAESDQTLPSEPLVFAKFPSSIVGPNEIVTWDRQLTNGVDFEAELAVVIGRRARNVTSSGALDHVAFYTCLNDVSARDLQFADGQWVRGKSLDTFCPIGPWLVSPDEIGDPGQLRISCTVSGEVMQDATTADMIFGIAELVSRLSRAFKLEPGDVVATGTPPGVGWFRKPKRVLVDGDEMVVAIEGIGELRNRVVVTG